MKQAPPLWDHQKKAIQMADYLPSLALFMDMGTGKTRTAVEIVRRRYAQNSRLMRTLILAPKVALKNWKNEWAMYSKVSPMDIVVLNQAGRQRKDAFLKAVQLPDMTIKRGKIIITNYEAMQMEELYELFQHWKPEVMICDESHRCKDHQGKRARRVVALASHAIHRYILTGTPILNSSMDIFNQYMILDNGSTFGQNFYAFRGMYFQDSNAGWSSKPGYFPKWEPRPECYQELSTKIYKKAIRAVKSECLDLPPLLKITHEVPLSAEQKRMYEEMKNEYLTFVKSHQQSGESMAVVAQLAITKALRLQQIVSGFANTDTGETHTIEDNPRLEILMDLLEDIVDAHKVIIWATFKENYRIIRDCLTKAKIGFTEITGETKDKDEAAGKFRTDPKCRVVIANQGAGGIAINLVEASYAIYYSRNFSLEHDLQSEARNYRGGSHIHEKITRIDLVAKDTIDELVLETLAKKQDVANQILDWQSRL